MTRTGRELFQTEPDRICLCLVYMNHLEIYNEKKVTVISVLQVHHLQKVLAKKRDPVTHVCFMEELDKVDLMSFLTQIHVHLTTTLHSYTSNFFKLLVIFTGRKCFYCLVLGLSDVNLDAGICTISPRLVSCTNVVGLCYKCKWSDLHKARLRKQKCLSCLQY